MLVAERVADRADPLAHPQRRRVAERRHRQPGLAVDLDQRDVGVRVGADQPRAQRAAVGQLHGDPLGAIDDVVVGEDAAVGVDDEAAAGAAARRVALARAAEIERAVEPVRRVGWPVAPRRRFDALPRVVVSMFTTAGLRRSTTSAKLTSEPIAGAAAAFDMRAARATAGLAGAPADDRGSRHAAGDDRADEKRDDSGQRDGDEGEAARHQPNQL